MSPLDLQSQNACDHEGETEPAIHDEIDPIALDPHQRLADEVTNGAAFGNPAECRMEEAAGLEGGPALGFVCAGALNQLAGPAPVSQRVREQGQTESEQDCVAAPCSELCVDRQRRRTFHQPLVNPKKPIGRKVEEPPAAGAHKRGKNLSQHGREAQQHQQNSDDEPLQGERDPAKEARAENGKKNPLKGQDECRGKDATRATAKIWAARKRRRLGGSIPTRATVEKILAMKRKPAVKIEMAAIRAKKSLWRGIGRLDSTKRSSRSGKKRSHSKTVMIPMAANE